jgi:hypothetical protein
MDAELMWGKEGEGGIYQYDTRRVKGIFAYQSKRSAKTVDTVPLHR